LETRNTRASPFPKTHHYTELDYLIYRIISLNALTVSRFFPVPRITGEKPQVNVSGFSVAVDWSKCFILNGPLDNYEVLENGLLIYEGLQNKRDLGTRNIGSKSS